MKIDYKKRIKNYIIPREQIRKTNIEFFNSFVRIKNIIVEIGKIYIIIYKILIKNIKKTLIRLVK